MAESFLNVCENIVCQVSAGRTWAVFWNGLGAKSSSERRANNGFSSCYEAVLPPSSNTNEHEAGRGAWRKTPCFLPNPLILASSYRADLTRRPRFSPHEKATWHIAWWNRVRGCSGAKVSRWHGSLLWSNLKGHSVLASESSMTFLSFIIIIIINYYYFTSHLLLIMVYVSTHARPRHTCGGQRTTFCNWFFLPTRWVPGVKLIFDEVRFDRKHRHPLS